MRGSGPEASEAEASGAAALPSSMGGLSGVASTGGPGAEREFVPGPVPSHVAAPAMRSHALPLRSRDQEDSGRRTPRWSCGPAPKWKTSRECSPALELRTTPRSDRRGPAPPQKATRYIDITGGRCGRNATAAATAACCSYVFIESPDRAACARAYTHACVKLGAVLCLRASKPRRVPIPVPSRVPLGGLAAARCPRRRPCPWG